MEISSRYPGSLGELLQGRLGDMDVLISCPINLYTNIELFETDKIIKNEENQKCSIFLENILNKWGYKEYIGKLDFNIKSEIPRGKGFASSTADLAALYSCLTKFFNREYLENELAKQCLKVEPTDSIIFNNMTIFDYKNGNYIRKLGNYIPFFSLCFIGDEVVDTINFNKKELPPLKNVEDLILLIEKGLYLGDKSLIFKASTESIMRNQHRLYYPNLPEIIKIKDETKGLGIIGAHSGDVIGIVYDSEEILDKVYIEIKSKGNFNICKVESVIDL